MRNSATNKIEPCTVVISAEASSADVTKFGSKMQSLSVQGSYKDSDNESTGTRQTWQTVQASGLFGGINTFGGSNGAMDGLLGDGGAARVFKFFSGAPATTLDDAEEEEKEAVVVNESQPDF